MRLGTTAKVGRFTPLASPAPVLGHAASRDSETSTARNRPTVSTRGFRVNRPATFATVEYGTPERLAMSFHSPFRLFRQSTTSVKSGDSKVNVSIYGSCHDPQTDGKPGYSPPMDKADAINAVRRVLAANSTALLDVAPSKASLYRALRPWMSQSSVSRMCSGGASVGVDHVTAFAAEFGLEPWQMLIADLDPDAPPRLDATRALSIDAVGIGMAFDLLDAEQRETVKTVLKLALGPRADDDRVARFLKPAPNAARSADPQRFSRECCTELSACCAAQLSGAPRTASSCWSSCGVSPTRYHLSTPGRSAEASATLLPLSAI